VFGCAKGADGMAAPHLPRPQPGNGPLCDHAGSARVTDVIERLRAGAAPTSLPGAAEILTEEALGFISELHQRFDGRRRELLAARIERQKRFDTGELPDFSP